MTAMEQLGARIVVAGKNLTEAAATAIELAASEDLTYVEDGEDPGLMAGAATVIWEMLEVEPELDGVIVPVGGGNLVAGSLLTAAMLRSETVVIGVQSAAAPGATLSGLRGAMSTAECRTSAGGLAAEQPGALALGVMHALLERVILVEEDIWKAVPRRTRSRDSRSSRPPRRGRPRWTPAPTRSQTEESGSCSRAGESALPTCAARRASSPANSRSRTPISS